MKSDQIIAELFALLRLLLERQPQPDIAARLAALEAWRAGVEAAWPKIKEN